MITKCDRYWWHVNRKNLIILFGTLPLALLFPVLSLALPGTLIPQICDQFFSLRNTGDKHVDSIRLILSMPFSRQQIASTYMKGSIFTALGYFIAVLILRSILNLFNFPPVLYWNNNLSLSFDLLTYFLILAGSLLLINIFVIMSLNSFSTHEKQLKPLGVIFGVFGLFSLQIVKYIFLVILVIPQDVEVELDYNLLTKSTAFVTISEVITVAIYLAVIGLLSFGLYSSIKYERNKFINGVSK